MKTCFLFFALLVATTGTMLRVLAQSQSLLYTVPFKAGDEGAKIYRIRAIWWQPKKPLMAFAEQRRMTGDVDIVRRRSFDDGRTWEPMQVIASLERDTCGIRAACRILPMAGCGLPSTVPVGRTNLVGPNPISWLHRLDVEG